MSSYHSSFTYLNKNSSGEGFIITAFEPDHGFSDTFLGMDQIVTDSYDGVKKHFYGSKYNSSAQILITLVKADGTDLSMADNRRALRWLTGNRQASWLDLYVNDKLVYSFYGSITACQQYKLDARVVGIQATFSSIHPWAWSAPQYFNCLIGQKPIGIDKDGVVYPTYEEQKYFGINENGVVYNSSNNESFTFRISADGTVYNDNSVFLEINNPSDDLYTLTSLDMVFTNVNSTSLTVENLSLGTGASVITGISPKETITLSAGQFIISQTFPTKIFGDDFNFVWPQLQPGINQFYIDGTGAGRVEFSYRYPIKIGDCAIDIDALGKNPMCEGDISGAIGSVDGITTLGRKNVVLIDGSTNKTYVASVKDSYLHIYEAYSNINNRVVLVEDKTGVLHEVAVDDNLFYLSEISKIDGNTAIRERIVLVDEIDNKPYELTVKDNTPNKPFDKDYSLYLSEI